MMIMNVEIEMVYEEEAMTYFKVLSQNLPGVTGENIKETIRIADNLASI
jgi:hypothetical protein